MSNNYPDNLKTTIYKQMAEKAGVDVNNLPDNLETTMLRAIADNMGSGGGGSGGGVSSWNDLTDKPFGEVVETTNSITWDGNPEGKEIVSVDGGAYVKVSDATITTAAMIGGSYTTAFVSNESLVEAIDESVIHTVADGFSIVGQRSDIAVVDKDEVNLDGIIFTRGIYFFFADGFFYVSNLTLSSDIDVLSIKKIDEKYLPESVDGVVIRSSTAYSTKKFKLTVNDSGNISAVEIGGK